MTCPARASIKGHTFTIKFEGLKYTSAKTNRPVDQFFAIVMAPRALKFLAALVWLSIFTALLGSIVDAKSTAAMISEQSARKPKGMSIIDTGARNHWPHVPGERKRFLHLQVHARESFYITGEC